MSSLVWRFFNILRYWAVTAFFQHTTVDKEPKKLEFRNWKSLAFL